MITSRLTRAQWGAVKPEQTPTRVSSMRGVAVHWVGGGTWGSAGIGDHSKCAAKIRGIQRSHMAGEYFDIAYSEGVCPHGARFELRGHNVQVGANGSSFANKNWYAVLALVGVGDKITPELLEGIALAVDDYRRNADAGDDVTAHRVLLKKYAGRTTSCCGDALYSHVVKGTFDAPTKTTAPPVQEDDMPTPAEVFKADVVNAPYPSETNPTWSAQTYLQAIYRNSVSAFREATAARRIAEASALKGEALTVDEVKAALAEVLDEKIEDGVTVLGVKGA